MSTFLADAAGEVFGIRRLLVIPNWIDPVSMGPLPLSDSERQIRFRSKRVLLHVSTLRPVRRAVDCVGILARVNRRVPCQLLVLGDAPDLNAVRSEAARRGMADRISLVGATANVWNYFAQADLLLLPSASEAFGMAAARVPVVTLAELNCCTEEESRSAAKWQWSVRGRRMLAARRWKRRELFMARWGGRRRPALSCISRR